MPAASALLAVALSLVGLVGMLPRAAADVLDEVNVFIGTGGRGFGFGATFPGPCVPFGAARPGPDTWGGALHAPFHHFGGYHRGDRWIQGFSHTRLSGIGVPDYGNLRLLPVPADGRDPRSPKSWRARFRHAGETARPGYYSVRLGGDGIRVELTATQWGAVHRYTFPKRGRWRGRVGIERYRALGWVPKGEVGDAASRTIEFSWADGALANLADALGKKEAGRRFRQRSHRWKALWDPKQRYLRGRNADGSFDWLFSATLWTEEWTEGNARQWLWAPLHDAEGLVDLLGGPAAFTRRLERFFARSTNRVTTLLPAMGYWHGNEPDIHAGYLFAFAGRPDLTQRWVRWVMDTSYADAPAGLDGNDDCGTLSAWYVWSALGLYPIAGSDRYVIGTPRFPLARVRRPGGDLVIRAGTDHPRSPYLRRVSLGRRQLPGPFLRHAEIAAGGDLRFERCAKPTMATFAAPRGELR